MQRLVTLYLPVWFMKSQAAYPVALAFPMPQSRLQARILAVAPLSPGQRPDLWQKSVSVVEEQILPLSAWADSFD
jgi:hypothetical protein